MPRKTYKHWSEKEENKLVELYKDGLTNKEIMDQLGRDKSSISHRIKNLKDRELIPAKRRTRNNKESYYAREEKVIEKFKTGKPISKKGIVSKENYKIILKMDARNERDGCMKSSRYNHVRYLNDVGIHLSKVSFLNANLEKNLLPFIIKRKGELKPSAYQPYESCLKNLYGLLIEKNGGKKNLIEINNFLNMKKRGRKKEYEPDVKEHLTRTEMVKLIAAIKGRSNDSIRNRALIACLYDSGARISELLSVRIKDVDVGETTVPKLFLPISKTRPRFSHLLNFSLPHLMKWLKIHEFLDNPEAPLFYSMSTANYGEHLTPNGAGGVFRRALKLSGIKKKISPHSLRHSKAYHCAEDGMMVSEANKLFGWGKTSGCFHFYATVKDEAIKLKELERAGKLTPEQEEARKLERNAFVMKKCAQCGTKSTPDQFLCGTCGLALHKDIAKKQLEKEKEIDMIKLEMEQIKKERKLETKLVDSSIQKGLMLNKELVKKLLKEMIKSGNLKN